MLTPGRSYSAGNQYRYGFNGQEKSNEISDEGNSYTAEFWEYDPRLGRRWNLDPNPNLGISFYATFGNNPIVFADPLGDTTRYYTEKNELLFTTYAKGYNHSVIVSREYEKGIKDFGIKNNKDILKWKNEDDFQTSVDAILKFSGVTYDIRSFENFYDNYYQKGAGTITNFMGRPISELSNIRVDGKSYTTEEFKKYVNSFGVGPEYVASLEKGKDGVYRVSTDVTNNNDLVSASSMERDSHIHLHPSIAMKKISYDYIFKEGPYKGTSIHHSFNATGTDVGPDSPDRRTAGFSTWSVVVNHQKVYLYNGSGNYVNTIPFNRKTRK